VKKSGLAMIWVSVVVVAAGLFLFSRIGQYQEAKLDFDKAAAQLELCMKVVQSCDTPRDNFEAAYARYSDTAPDPVYSYFALGAGGVLLLLGTILFAAGRIEESNRLAAG
tara:strand:+ start:255 stop:584 length:330 start_codon:yes stop_codon:yes gene_type:complete